MLDYTLMERACGAAYGRICKKPSGSYFTTINKGLLITKNGALAPFFMVTDQNILSVVWNRT